jgi:hypothetical protein
VYLRHDLNLSWLSAFLPLSLMALWFYSVNSGLQGLLTYLLHSLDS